MSNIINKIGKKSTISIIIGIILLIVVVLGIGKCNKDTQREKQKETYIKAINCLINNNSEEAINIFKSLPENFAYSEHSLTPLEWLTEIDIKYNSSFLGYWGNSYYSIKITQRIDIFGIDVEYHKEVGNIYLTYEGYLNLNEHKDTSVYLSSNKGSYYYESGAYNYRLELVDENTLEVYFKSDLEQTLKRR